MQTMLAKDHVILVNLVEFSCRKPRGADLARKGSTPPTVKHVRSVRMATSMRMAVVRTVHNVQRGTKGSTTKVVYGALAGVSVWFALEESMARRQIALRVPVVIFLTRKGPRGALRVRQANLEGAQAVVTWKSVLVIVWLGATQIGQGQIDRRSVEASVPLESTAYQERRNAKSAE
jgi:hypothetical protein